MNRFSTLIRLLEQIPTAVILIAKRHKIPRLGSKAKYLIWNTLKVVGDLESGLNPVDGAIFNTKADPQSGGTGHTIRVCKE